MNGAIVSEAQKRHSTGAIAVVDGGGNLMAVERIDGVPGEDAIDGIKVDERGNLDVSGPGGLWILSAEGRHLGTIVGPKHPHNMAWGDDDGKTLYLCAQSGLYRMRLGIPGAGRPRSASGAAP